jgi:serine/threonine protein kinase
MADSDQTDTTGGSLRADDPRVVGPYHLFSRIGSGGMGVVYLAEDPAGHRVAVKLVRPELADDPAFRSRFRREVQAGQRVGGICTAKYLDADLDSDHPYLVTEYVEGGNLADYVNTNGPLIGDQLVGLAVGLAEAVVAMHASGVTHRDLKPTNVLMAASGPKVVDFGISHAADGTAVTQTGVVVGSPSWMAPEQAQGRGTTPAVDVFSWGATVAFAATGRFPFGEGRPDAVIYRVVHEEPDLSGVDPKLLPMVAAALRKDPSARPAADKLLVDVVKTAMAGEVPRGGPVAMTNLVLDRTWAQEPPATTKRGRGRLIAVVAASVVLIAGFVAGALYVAHEDQSVKSPQHQASGTVVHHPSEASTTIAAPSTTSTTTVSVSAPASTVTDVFAPWTPAGVLAPGILVVANLNDGSCTIGSIADSANQSAWRCFSGSGVYDPCFAPPQQSNVTQVACAGSPLSGVDMMTLTTPLPYSSAETGNTESAPDPWFMQLANGDKCGQTSGTSESAGGVTLSYVCQSGAAGALNTATEPWTVKYLPNNSHVISDVAVTTAWN